MKFKAPEKASQSQGPAPLIPQFIDGYTSGWDYVETVPKSRIPRMFLRCLLLIPDSCGSRIFMQPSEDRHDEGRGRLGIQQRCRIPQLVRDDRPARRCSRTGVFATDDSNPDTTT